MIFQYWRKSIQGIEAITNVYSNMAGSNPTRFELDREVRRKYEKYKENYGK